MNLCELGCPPCSLHSEGLPRAPFLMQGQGKPWRLQKFLSKPLQNLVHIILATYGVVLATFQALDSHMWPLATVEDRSSIVRESIAGWYCGIWGI